MSPNTFRESPALLKAGWFKGSSHLRNASTAASGGCLNKQLVIIASPSRPTKLTITSFNFQRHIPPSPYRGNYSSSFIISALEISLTYGPLSPLPFLIFKFHPKPQILSLPRNTVSDFPWMKAHFIHFLANVCQVPKLFWHLFFQVKEDVPWKSGEFSLQLKQPSSHPSMMRRLPEKAVHACPISSHRKF